MIRKILGLALPLVAFIAGAGAGAGTAPGAPGGSCCGWARMNGTVAERRLPNWTTRL